MPQLRARQPGVTNPASPEEEFIEVGAMNLGMTHGARLILRILRMETWRFRNITARGRCVTLEAEQIDLAHTQQSRIR